MAKMAVADAASLDAISHMHVPRLQARRFRELCKRQDLWHQL